jgi:2-dehydropantoate 2-reductase
VIDAMKKVLIYGAGAIGSFMGYLLSEIDDANENPVENVAILGRLSHIKRIKEEGLRISSKEESMLIRFKHCFSDILELEESGFTPEMVIICVKTHSLHGLCLELKASGLLERSLKDAEFVLLMNGMGNRDIFDIFDDAALRIHEGITAMGVKFPEDGRIELKGMGLTVLEDGLARELKEFLRRRFEEKGFEIEFSKDFKRLQWNKLFVNAVINPITALTRRENGIILSLDLGTIVERIVDECVEVAGKKGVKAEKNSVLQFVYSVAEKTSENSSSMLQDVLKGRRTEIDSINGYVIGLAKEHGIQVPVNESLYALVRSMERRNTIDFALPDRSRED